MLNPATLPLRASRNADFYYPLTFQDAVSDAALDLTGYSFRAMVRAYAGASGSPLIDLPHNPTAGLAGVLDISLVAGQVQLFIPKATLLDLAAADAANPATPSVLAWDMTWLTPAGETDLLFQGSFTVNTGVVR